MSFGKPGCLREDQRRLQASAPQQSDGFPGLRELLRQHLDEAEITLGEELHYELVPAALRRRLQYPLRLEFGDFLQQSMLRLLCRLDLVQRLAYLLRDLPDVGRKHCRRFGEGLEIAARRADRSQAADKLHPHALLHFLGLAQQHAAYLSGALHVSSAASVQIEIADLDQTAASRVPRAGFCARPACALRQRWQSESQPDGPPR